MPELDKTPLLDVKGKLRVQKVVGSFLYYAWAVDLTILASLSKIASMQAAPTEYTMQKVNHFLDYMASNPDALVRFYASDMVLNCHSDASYLTAKRVQSRAGGHFFLGSVPKDGCPIFLNGTTLTNCTILDLVAASAVETEVGVILMNAMEVKMLRLTLEEFGNAQPSTPIHVEVGIMNSTIKRERSRTMNMSYFWMLCQEAQRILNVKHHPGAENWRLPDQATQWRASRARAPFLCTY